MYAKELRDTPIKVNAAKPRIHQHRLQRPPGIPHTEGAEPSVHLATVPDDGPSGCLWGNLWTHQRRRHGPLPW
jgi:hypothetical protein